MSRVHILTFHRALNYGAILQCYGLHKTVSRIKDCDVIDYRAECIEKRYKVFTTGNSLKGFAKAIITAPAVNQKRKKFDDFIRNNIATTQSIKDRSCLKNIPWSDSDLFCVGSDQVWNLDLVNGDTSFLFDFLPDKATRFSYAASIGADVRSEWQDTFKTYLKKFSGVSVRETTAQEQLNKYGILTSVEIDPVFLLTKEEWFETAQKIESKSYVLIYLLQKADSFMKTAIEYARKHGKQVIIISSGLKRQYKAQYVTDCGPEEFLGYFKEADVIFTNSFHGIVFSVLFNKQFYYQLQGNQVKTNSRLFDVISLFHLEKREIENIDDETEIDYAPVNVLIESKRECAIKYLKSQIMG